MENPMNNSVPLSSFPKDDDPSTTAITIPLHHDEDRAALLRSTIYRNTLPSHQDSPRSLIAAKEVRRIYYFQARFRSARVGVHGDTPACLVILDFDFQQLSGSRFKSAKIEVNFEDAENVYKHTDPHGDEEVDTTYQPHILDFQPRQFVGVELSRDAQGHLGAGVQLSAPGGVAGVTGDYGKDLPSVKKGALKVHGVLRDSPPSRIVLVMRENELTNEGIPPTFSLPLIVSYTPGRRFAARVRVEADIWWSFIFEAVCGVKDDPIFFDPGKMKGAQKLTSATGAGVVINDEDLGLLDLKALTLLDTSIGRFL